MFVTGSLSNVCGTGFGLDFAVIEDPIAASGYDGTLDARGLSRNLVYQAIVN